MTMNMPTKPNSQNKLPNAALKIIEEIEIISADSECIYRGEPEDAGKISSSLYREFADCDEELIDLELIQRDMINEVKQYLYKKNDLDILTELQHYGGKTNLIDFTADHLIALFFACYGALGKDGRVIVQNTAIIEDWILKPKNPRHRVSVQKIVFVQPPKGYIEPDESQIVTIPANLKQPLLQHLRTEHNISTDTMFNNLYSFIRKQEIHRDAYIEYYSGLSLQKTGNKSDSIEKKKAAYAEAVECYTNAIKLKPDFLKSYKNRGIICAGMDDVDRAIEDYTTVIQLDPNYSDIYLYRGMAYLLKGDFDQSIEDFSKEIELNPTNDIAYLFRGIVSELKGDSYQVIKDVSLAIELNPDSVKAYSIRGKTYGNIGEHDLAIQDYDKVIELNPEKFGAYNNRGNAYGDKGDYDRAIQDYDKAIELNPEKFEAYNNRGNAYGDKGDYDRAIQDYDKVIELNPESFEAYNNRGSAYGGKGDYDRAIQDYDKAIELNPEKFEAYNNRGKAYGDKGDYDRAIQDYDKAIELNPEEVNVYNSRGIAYVRKGDYDCGIKDYDKVIELDPESDLAYCNRGEAWLHLQEWEKAKLDLTTAKIMDYDIIESFRNDYENVADFEQKNNIKIPADIAAMLTPPQQ